MGNRMSKDTIYRQDVIELVENSYYNLAESIEDTWAMVSDVEKLPSAEPRKKGKWIDSRDVSWMCSECGKWLDVLQGDVDMNFCPNCGADMEG